MARIVSTPGVCDGRPRIAGTRVPVARIDRMVHHEGLSPSTVAMVLEIPLTAVYHALAYAMSPSGLEDPAAHPESEPFYPPRR